MKSSVLGRAVCAAYLTLAASTAYSAIIVTQTTDGTALGTALGGSGLTINSVTAAAGGATQFGTYTNFNLAPVTIGNGVVLSTGLVSQTPAPASTGNTPSTSISGTSDGSSGTPEFAAYGPGNIINFQDANDVAKLTVNFTLGAPGQIKFDFIFGSIEFPVFTSSFTDAFLVFLDGTDPSNQITFDSNGDPVQVGGSFASELTTADQNTAVAAPHGLISNLTTVSPVLAAGAHTIHFEVGDVNDSILDSAAFIANFGLCVPGQNQACVPGTTPPNGAPEPGSLALIGIALAGIVALRRRRVTI
jgi:hypothetical protein